MVMPFPNKAKSTEGPILKNQWSGSVKKSCCSKKASSTVWKLVLLSIAPESGGREGALKFTLYHLRLYMIEGENSAASQTGFLIERRHLDLI